MIGCVTVGTNDLARGAVFYDAIASELGTGRMMENDQFIAWGAPGRGAGIGLTRLFRDLDGNKLHAFVMEPEGREQGAG